MKTIRFIPLAFCVGFVLAHLLGCGAPTIDLCDSDSGLGCTVTPTHPDFDMGDAGDSGLEAVR